MKKIISFIGVIIITLALFTFFFSSNKEYDLMSQIDELHSINWGSPFYNFVKLNDLVIDTCTTNWSVDFWGSVWKIPQLIIALLSTPFQVVYSICNMISLVLKAISILIGI